MLFIIGTIVIIICVIGSFAIMGGHLEVLNQPYELAIIFGSACGALIISNPFSNIKKVLGALKEMLACKMNTKESFIELLSVLYVVCKFSKSKGNIKLESHADNPEESAIFTEYPGFLAKKEAVQLLCDALRVIIIGITNPHQIEELMEEEISTFSKECSEISGAVEAMADGLPALGIVAAVLGVIKTMGHINDAPEILGGLIGSALVGTFLGVLLAYGFVAPIANIIKKLHNDRKRYLECIKTAVIAHLSGCAPAISIEFARKTIFADIRPTFQELDPILNSLSIPNA